jgi:hypothetical protein
MSSILTVTKGSVRVYSDVVCVFLLDQQHSQRVTVELLTLWVGASPDSGGGWNAPGMIQH